MLDQIKDQISQITATDFQALRMWITAEEKPRRESADARSEGQTEVVADLRERGVIESPAIPEDPADPGTYPVWENPGTDHSRMYLIGDRVRHQGKTWLNTHPHLNHWPPGTLNGGWIDVTPAPIDEETGEPQIIAWGVGQAVQPGDLRTHDGQTWECILAHTTHEGWAPSPAAHTVWKLA